MPRKSEFPIHVDSSCLTDTTDLQLPSKRNDSDQTVIRKEIEDSQSHLLSEGSQVDSQGSDDDNTEAFIHAAARAVIASMRENGYGQEDSVLSARTEDGYEAGTEGTYGTELTYGDATELSYDSDANQSNRDPYDGSASSHHDDDVFSQGVRSNRSSLNSCTDGEEHWKIGGDGKFESEYQSKHIEESPSPISRIPSTTSNAYSLLPEPLTITASPNPHTPSNALSRPAFRTPSSVRAMQMSSPTPSIFSGSPRSSKRPTVSRLGTPSAHSQSPAKNKTPTRFKAKKEYPLVLLHVTVLPLQWNCGDVLDAVGGEGLPKELQGVKDSWKLLKAKLRDTVLERGILLPHPQDSYELLEERFLETLELPVRPRAKILSCGHYLGPEDDGDSSSEDGSEDEEEAARIVGSRERWCDICGREVKCEEIGITGKQKRFRVKVYASNGLMRAGAWAAAWREMERVDIEIEPFLPSHLAPLMDSLMAFHSQPLPTQGLNHGLPDRNESDESETRLQEEAEAMRRLEMEEERMREIYGDSPPIVPQFNESTHSQRFSSRQRYGDSLPELIWAAMKVLMRDKKQVAICILSVLVLILALRPTNAIIPDLTDSAASHVAIAGGEMGSSAFGQEQEMMGAISERVLEMPAKAVAAVETVDHDTEVAPHPEEHLEVTAERETFDDKPREGGCGDTEIPITKADTIVEEDENVMMNLVGNPQMV